MREHWFFLRFWSYLIWLLFPKDRVSIILYKYFLSWFGAHCSSALPISNGLLHRFFHTAHQFNLLFYIETERTLIFTSCARGTRFSDFFSRNVILNVLGVGVWYENLTFTLNLVFEIWNLLTPSLDGLTRLIIWVKCQLDLTCGFDNNCTFARPRG